MIWAVIFQLCTVFIFVIIFFNDRHNQGVVSRKKRFLYSIFLFTICGIIFNFLPEPQGKNNSFPWIIINGMGGLLCSFVKEIYVDFDILSILMFPIPLISIFIFHFPSFLIFWIWFSKDTRIKMITTALYILWCAISIWLCLTFPDREQRSAQLRRMLEEKRTQEISSPSENRAQEEHTNAETMPTSH